MTQSFVCPLCGDTNVTFSGTKGLLSLRSTAEWVVPLICANSHTFYVLLADASSQLGLEGPQFRSLRELIARSERALLRSRQLVARINAVLVRQEISQRRCRDQSCHARERPEGTGREQRVAGDRELVRLQ